MAPNEPFFDQFIDDFFSECDEHLATIRRVLLELEERSGPANRTGLLQELARALHTVKGLSGMVGLVGAEHAAHAMEDAVRAIRDQPTAEPAVLESLFAGERLLELSIEARRTGQPPLSADEYIDRIRGMLASIDAGHSSDSSLDSSPLPGSQSVALVPASPATQRFQFSPSAELAGRSVGVELIRQRLLSLGTIIATTPHVRPAGGVTFDFLVAMREGALPDEAWRADGLSWEAPGRVSIDAEVSAEVAQPAAKAATTAPPVTAGNVVRVDLARLDDLMRMVGELVVTRARLDDALSRATNDRASGAWDDVSENNDLIERQIRTIREGVMRMRLVQVGEVFERMRFAMREIARESAKAIQLEFSGQETEIDKVVVDRILEPLMHLVRNSASHGIESAAERAARGKRPEGTITLRAKAAGDRIVLEVEDDGAGIDIERVSDRAAELGLVASGHAVPQEALLDVLCTPGFSTRESADMASGRGVGMSVVRTTIRALGGDLLVDSVIGQGTKFTIELPLTLMITDALIMEIGDQAMAIPQIALREIVALNPALVTRLENNEVMSYRGRALPLINLGALFRLPSRPDAKRHVLIVGSDTQPVGLAVDRVLGIREIVVHPLADPLVTVPGVAGATELADGRISLILDAAALVRGSRDRAARARLHRGAPRELPATTRAASEGPWA